MHGRVAKITAAILLIVILLTASLLIFINPILNTQTFKRALNSLLNKEGVKIAYGSVDADILHGYLSVRGLRLTKEGTLKADISRITVMNIYQKDRMLVSVSEGYVDIKIDKKQKHKKQKGKAPYIPPIPQLDVENLRIKINGIPIVVERLEAEGLKEGSFVVSSPETFKIKGKITKKERAIIVNIEELHAKSTRVAKLLEELGVKVNLPILKEEVEVDLRGSTLSIGTSPFSIEADLGGPISIKTATKSYLLNDGFLRAKTKIKYSADEKRLLIGITDAHGSFEEIKEIIGLFTRAKVLQNHVYPIVKSALVKRASVRILLHPTEVDFKAEVDNAIVKIPKTDLTAKAISASVQLKGKGLNISISRAKVGRLSLKDSSLNIQLKKPLSLNLVALIKGKAPDVYPIIRKVPIPQRTLTEIEKHRLLSGDLEAKLGLIFKNGKLDISIAGKIKRADVFDPLVNEKIQAENIKISFQKPFLRIDLTGAKSDSLSIEHLSVRIAPENIKIKGKKAKAKLAKIKAPLFLDLIKKANIHRISGHGTADRFTLTLGKGKIQSFQADIHLTQADVSLNATRIIEAKIPSAMILIKWPKIRIFNSRMLIQKAKIQLKSAEIDIERHRLTLTASSSTPNELLRLAEKITGKSIPVDISKNTHAEATIAVNLKDRSVKVKGATLKGNSAALNISASIDRDLLKADCALNTGKITKIHLEKTASNASITAKGETDLQRLFELVKPTDNSTSLPKRGKVITNLSANLREKSLSAYGTLILKEVKLQKSSITGTLHLEGRRAWIEGLRVEAPEGSATLSGRAYFAPEKIQFFVSARGKYLNLNEFQPSKKKKGEEKKAMKLQGRVVFNFDRVDYKEWEIDEVQGDLLIDQEKDLINANIDQATICGFTVRAQYKKAKRKQRLSASSTGENTFDNLFQCLLHKKEKIITGNFTYKVKADSEGEDLVKGLSGEAELVSKKGRIYKMGLLMKILQTLSIANILTLNIPNFKKKGFPYKKLVLKARLKKGKVKITDSYLDSPAVKLVPYGEIDLTRERLNMVVLAAPFTTIDKIISSIPVLGRILTGQSRTFISFPLKVEGKLKDPSVIPLPPSAISKGIFGVIKRTFEAPAEILKPNHQ